MKPETIIAELRSINAWRRGEDGVNPPEPKHMGEVLDAAADSLASLIASNTTLRRERREARAEVAQLKGALELGQENCDAEYEALREERDEAEKSVAHLKEANTVLLDDVATLRAANAERQKQEAESRRLFYSEQDKRQSAEYRIAELEAALRKIAAQKPEKPDYWTSCGQCDSNIEDAKDALARPAAGEPAKHPDTERLDWLEIDPQARLAEIRRLIFTDRDTVREAIEAARKEVKP